MARLSDVGRQALGYWWNLISDAATVGLPVTDTISMANQIARDAGESLTPETNRAISSLYGYARRMVNAGNTFTASSPSQGITADMIATPPYARDIQEQTTFPIYHVKFQYTYLDQAGNEQTTIRTSVFDNGLGATVGDVTADVLDDAEGFAAKYGHTLLSATPIQILAV